MNWTLSPHIVHKTFNSLATLFLTAIAFIGCREKERIDEATWNGIVELPGGVTLQMVKVEAGTFEMSSSADGKNYFAEVPHQVTLKHNFYIGQTEVTQAQWEAVMKYNAVSHPYRGDDRPVCFVTWNDAMKFCKELNATGKAPRGWKFTLPTETQWEYAARGGNKSLGYIYSGSNNPDEVAWYGAKKDFPVYHPVGRKKANELGLYDMSGNVWEWCLDDWGEDSSKLQAEFSRGNDRGGQRAKRGGDLNNNAAYCRSANRDHDDATFKSDIGLRLALVPDL